ncbi:DUF89 family protein [Candidatus Poribacteria bacterium]|nr:DUF89 family protein [Candidatus Poribacteria bacterium]
MLNQIPLRRCGFTYIKEISLIAKIECIPCIIDDIRGALELLTDDEELKRRVMKKSLEYMAENADLGKEPSIYITEVHRIIKRVCKIELPFAQRREMCNQMGLQLAQRLRKTISGIGGYERFSLLARWSIAANSLDFRTVGTGYDFDLDELEKEMNAIADILDVSHLPQIYEMIKSAEKVLFIHDNVGEIAIDKLLIEDIKGNGDTRVVAAVRGGPITSDATIDDAQQVKLHESASEVIIAGPDTLGISFDEMSEDLIYELSQADIVIVKGQANYYVFSEHKNQLRCPVVSLFRTKCPVVSNIFGHPENISIAAVL